MKTLLLLLVLDNCGIPPIPPIPPIGTSQCAPVCQCDEHGRNCHFVFECE